MSLCETILITCQKCREDGAFNVWNSVNADLDPEIKKSVIDGSAFVFKCPHCGTTTYVNYDMLYHDMRKRFMVFCNYKDDAAQNTFDNLTSYDEDSHEFKLIQNGYKMRLVRNHNELREKVMIAEAGLDDRIIEIFKCYVRLYQTHAGEKVENKEYYYYKANGRDFIQVIKENGELGGSFSMPPHDYNDIKNRYAAEIIRYSENNPIIDSEWAEDIFFRKGRGQ